MTESARSITASRLVQASADRVFDYLARPENHRGFDTSGMVRGSRENGRIEAAGTTFTMTMHNDIKGDHEVENHVVVFEPGRAIGWSPAAPGEAPAGHTWIWRLADDGAGNTVVSQTYDWSQFSRLDMIDHLPVIDGIQLQRSVDLLAHAVEQDHQRRS